MKPLSVWAKILIALICIGVLSLIGYAIYRYTTKDQIVIPTPQDRKVLKLDKLIISPQQADQNCSPSATAMGAGWDHHGYRDRFDASLRAGKIPVWNAWFSSAGEISDLSKPGWWLDARNHRRYITQRDVMLKLIAKENYWRCVSLRSSFLTPSNIINLIPEQLA